MAIQERKQIISDEVADDANFLKSLTAEDIAFLFD